MSDVARFNNHKPEEGVDSLVSYLRQLPREAPAGTRLLYSTGETNLVGVLLGRATKKPLATYLSEKIWVPAGMEQQATWILSRAARRSAAAASRPRRATSPASASSSSMARASTARASCPRAGSRRRPAERTATGRPGRGYGYQWWTYTDGTFAARGIFGQGIFFDPKRKVVIVSNANWGGGATDRIASEAREAFYRTVLKAVDDEAAAAASAPAKP